MKHVDTVTFSLTKGLCMPFGSIVAGSKDFITKFNISKRMMGGVFRKMGMFAGMGIVSLKTIRF